MGGTFEKLIDSHYQKSLRSHEAMRRDNSRSGSALTISGKCPLCDEEWALRHPAFADYESAHIACEYFTGGIFGPDVSPYEHADHAVWLLSDASTWLTERVHAFLLEGIANWAIWHWGSLRASRGADWATDGALADALYGALGGKAFKWTAEVNDDIQNRFQRTINLLRLPENTIELHRRFLEYDFVGTWIRSQTHKHARRKRSAKTKPGDKSTANTGGDAERRGNRGPVRRPGRGG
jgi:hypothetical protein